MYANSQTRTLLYSECGSAHVVCIGARQSQKSINSKGCIKDQNCQVFLKVKKLPPSTSTQFQWTLAMEKSSEPSVLALAITKEKITDYKLVPYAIMQTFHDQANLTPSICSFGYNSQPCLRGFKSSQLDRQNFIKFNPIKESTAGQTHYLISNGLSDQRLSIEHREETNNGINHEIRYNIDLIEDKFTITLLHGSGSQLVNVVNDIEPQHWFNVAPTAPPSTTLEPLDKEVVNDSKEKANLLWLWIGLAFIGLIIITLIVFSIVYCFCLKSAAGKSTESNKGKPNQAMATKKTVSNKNGASVFLVGSPTKGVPRKGGGGRLDYITQLAGYDPHKPVTGNKKTTEVKEHDFNEPFVSAEVTREPPKDKPIVLYQKP